MLLNEMCQNHFKLTRKPLFVIFLSANIEIAFVISCELNVIILLLKILVQTNVFLRQSKRFCRWCCNLCGGVALIMWFTTNGMCVKDNTIIYVERASNSKRDCVVVALPILTRVRLNIMTSVRDEKLRTWSILLLAATVRSLAHMPLGISDRINGKTSHLLLCFRSSIWLQLVAMVCLHRMFSHLWTGNEIQVSPVLDGKQSGD